MRIHVPAFGRVEKSLLHSDLSDRAKVLWAILDERSQLRTALSRKQLADLLRCSVRSLDRAVEELEEGGWLVIERVRRGDGTNLPSIYTLACPAQEIGTPTPTVRLASEAPETAPPAATSAPPGVTGAGRDGVTGAGRDGVTGVARSTRDVLPRRTTENKAELGGVAYVSSAADSNAPPMCSKHPDGPAHDEPCRPCGKVRKWLEQQPDPDDLERRRRAQAITQANAECRSCDPNGFIERNDGTGVIRCTHNPAWIASVARPEPVEDMTKDEAMAYLRSRRATANAAAG